MAPVPDFTVEPVTKVVARRKARLVTQIRSERIDLIKAHFAKDEYYTAEMKVAELRNCILDMGSGLLVESDGKVNAQAINVLRHYVAVDSAEYVQSVVDAQSAVVPQRALHVFHRSCGAFGHFVLDALGTLAVLRDKIVAENIRVVLPAFMPHWAVPAMAEIGISADMLLPLHGVCRFDRLLVPSNLNAVNAFRPSSSLIAHLRSAVDLPPAAAPRERKIYLSRQGAYSARDVSNEDEVIAVFKAAGFDIIVPQDLTFSDQVELFASAAVIAGNHGSAFANMVFAPPGAQIIDLMAEHWIAYWTAGSAERWLLDLTAACDHDYTLLVSPSELIGSVRSPEVSAAESRIVAHTDIASLRAILG